MMIIWLAAVACYLSSWMQDFLHSFILLKDCKESCENYCFDCAFHSILSMYGQRVDEQWHTHSISMFSTWTLTQACTYRYLILTENSQCFKLWLHDSSILKYSYAVNTYACAVMWFHVMLGKLPLMVSICHTWGHASDWPLTSYNCCPCLLAQHCNPPPTKKRKKNEKRKTQDARIKLNIHVPSTGLFLSLSPHR